MQHCSGLTAQSVERERAHLKIVDGQLVSPSNPIVFIRDAWSGLIPFSSLLQYTVLAATTIQFIVRCKVEINRALRGARLVLQVAEDSGSADARG